MKTLMTTLALLVVISGTTLAQSSVIGGVEFTEITDLGAPRVTRNVSATPNAPVYTAQLPPPPTSTFPATNPTTVFAGPADQRPVLFNGQTATYPTAAPQKYVYGYGYTSNGCNAIQPVGYTNTVPLQQPVTVTPLNSTPLNPYVQTKGVPWRPIFNIRSLPSNVVVGQGLIGQPVAYVPNQPVRNFFRYISP